MDMPVPPLVVEPMLTVANSMVQVEDSVVAATAADTVVATTEVLPMVVAMVAVAMVVKAMVAEAMLADKADHKAMKI